MKKDKKNRADKDNKVNEKKKYLIGALKRCLSRDVYSRITVQDVADEANMSKGGLLYYFPTKEQMYLELMKDLFDEIEREQLRILPEDIGSIDRANISAFYGIEKFVLDDVTIKILINLILYSYEEKKIMVPLKHFIRRHLDLYINIIKDARSQIPSRRKTDFDPQFTGRIAQTIVLTAGLLESIDPIEIDPMNLIEYIRTLFRG